MRPVSHFRASTGYGLHIHIISCEDSADRGLPEIENFADVLLDAAPGWLQPSAVFAWQLSLTKSRGIQSCWPSKENSIDQPGTNVFFLKHHLQQYLKFFISEFRYIQAVEDTIRMGVINKKDSTLRFASKWFDSPAFMLDSSTFKCSEPGLVLGVYSCDSTTNFSSGVLEIGR